MGSMAGSLRVRRFRQFFCRVETACLKVFWHLPQMRVPTLTIIKPVHSVPSTMNRLRRCDRNAFIDVALYVPGVVDTTNVPERTPSTL